MRTPRFECSQDEEFVHVRVHVPYVRTQDFEFSIDGSEFRFYVKPFLLHLDFRKEIVEDGRESVEYDYETGYAEIDLPKKEAGTYFENLAMLSWLLNGSKVKREGRKAGGLPQIEVIRSCEFEGLEEEEEDDGETKTGADGGEGTRSVETRMDQLLITEVTYGFLGRYSSVFQGREDDLSEIIELKDPEHVVAQRRRELRLEKEADKFDPEHYAADFAFKDALELPMAFELNVSEFVKLTEVQNDELLRLPKREYLVRDHHRLLCDLANILFAYLYDLRATLAETNVESGWTIARISPTMSWFEDFDTAQGSILTAFRRSLAYPLYRNFDLSQLVLTDLKNVLRHGRIAVLYCLLSIKSIFERDDLRRLLNDLYIIDYCVWIQVVRDDHFERFVNEVVAVTIDKSDIEWELEEIEDIVKEADCGS